MVWNPSFLNKLRIQQLRQGDAERHRNGAHALPVEQGRLDRPAVLAVPRHLRRCTFCTTWAVGDERHCLFGCPHFGGLRSGHAQLFDEAHGAMGSLM